MAQVCSICQSPMRAAAEAMHDTSRASIREISRTLDIPYERLKHHLRNHDRLVADTAPPRRGTQAAARAASREFGSAVETFEAAFGFRARDYQVEYLTATQDVVWRKGRQIGASQCAAALAIHTARTEPGSDSVIVSATQRQSSEVAVRARLGLEAIGETLLQDSASVLRLTNGSRILSLAQSARGVRGYSARLLVMDEAAFIPDETWHAARPMTSATGGRTVVQSTPGVPAGWFYELTQDVPPGWASMVVSSEESGIVSAAFLAAEKARMEPHIYAQEYGAQFASLGSTGRWFHLDDYDERVDDRFVAIDLDKEGT